MPLNSLESVLLLIVSLLAVAFLAAILGRHIRKIIYPLCTLLSLCLLALHSGVLMYDSPTATMSLPLGLPVIGMHFRLDLLAAFFGIVINLGGVMASFYAIGYGRTEKEPGRVLPFYPAFLAGMNLVLLADDAFTFLVAWEFMSLSSWAMVVARHNEHDSRHAGYIYLLMASFGALALLFGFGALAGSAGSYAFDTIRASAHTPVITSLVLAMTIIGAGSKAGIAPLHVWLPLAHPAAPSHVSALMSGVMTKVAIYAIIRIIFDLCGEPAWWWAIPFMIIGALTALLGILHALMQDDIKKILAYSTIENIGIITVGIGMSIAFRASNMPAAAAVAMMAVLLHILNHSLFKGLLFMGAGSVIHGCGLSNIEKMGGLIHRMPITAVVVLTGCAAAAALPPLNGFVSEWVLFQSILASPDLPQMAMRFLVPAAGAMLALSAALAAGCLVRFFGVAFLSRPRSEQAATAHEVDGFSISATGMMAILCLLTGLLAAPVASILSPLNQMLVGGQLPVQSNIPALFSLTPFAAARSSYNAPILASFILISSGLTFWCIYIFASSRQRLTNAWDCGFPDNSANTQYTASSFAQPLRRVFGTAFFSAREEVIMPQPGETKPARFMVHMTNPVWNWCYAPLARIVWSVSGRLNLFNSLTIRRYLTLMFWALIILLIVAVIWR